MERLTVYQFPIKYRIELRFRIQIEYLRFEFPAGREGRGRGFVTVLLI